MFNVYTVISQTVNRQALNAQALAEQGLYAQAVCTVVNKSNMHSPNFLPLTPLLEAEVAVVDDSPSRTCP